MTSRILKRIQSDNKDYRHKSSRHQKSGFQLRLSGRRQQRMLPWFLHQPLSGESRGTVWNERRKAVGGCYRSALWVWVKVKKFIDRGFHLRRLFHFEVHLTSFISPLTPATELVKGVYFNRNSFASSHSLLKKPDLLGFVPCTDLESAARKPLLLSKWISLSGSPVRLFKCKSLIKGFELVRRCPLNRFLECYVVGGKLNLILILVQFLITYGPLGTPGTHGGCPPSLPSSLVLWSITTLVPTGMYYGMYMFASIGLLSDSRVCLKVLFVKK